MKENVISKLSIFKYVFATAGIGLLAGAYFSYSNTKGYLSNAITTEGTVIDIVPSKSKDLVRYTPVVRYTTAGGRQVEFTSSMASTPSRYSREDVVEVLYDAKSPEKAKINSFFSLWGGTAVLGAIGSVFLFSGLSMTVLGKLKYRKINYLKRQGTPVEAKFQRVDTNSAVRLNGKHPYQIYTHWINPRTTELHVFKSENIWFDPTDYITQEMITVFLERNNPKKYYVDISFLPKLSN